MSLKGIKRWGTPIKLVEGNGSGHPVKQESAAFKPQECQKDVPSSLAFPFALDYSQKAALGSLAATLGWTVYKRYQLEFKRRQSSEAEPEELEPNKCDNEKGASADNNASAS